MFWSHLKMQPVQLLDIYFLASSFYQPYTFNFSGGGSIIYMLLRTINVILSAAKAVPRTIRFLLKNKVRNISAFLMKPFLTRIPLGCV